MEGKHKLKLVRWANDGYPPIDLREQNMEVVLLIGHYQSIEQDLKSLKEENELLKKRVTFWFDEVNSKDCDRAAELIDLEP